ncbi:SCO family protein [Terrarubrum flagellatum]|uniref:SCO family protein n=1 Tax=Terrirubrum flagellatum TaxID=2895980 RepID=UPI0031456828
MTQHVDRSQARATRRAFLAGALPLSLTGAVARADPLANRFGGPFSLTDHNGRRVTDQDFRGRWLLIYFGFTQCVDLCPVDMPVMATALDAIGPLIDKVQPLFITVDPDNDKPEILKGYVTAFHPSILGLTGTRDEIASVTKAYRVHRMLIPTTATQKTQTGHDHMIDHGSLTYLMGPDGGFVTLIPHGTDAKRMAEIIRAHVK